MKRVDRHDDAVAGLALDAAHVNCDMQHADLADDTAFMPVDLHERQGAEKDPAQAAQNEAQAVAEARDAAVAALAEAVVPADGDNGDRRILARSPHGAVACRVALRQDAQLLHMRLGIADGAQLCVEGHAAKNGRAEPYAVAMHLRKAQEGRRIAAVHRPGLEAGLADG